MRAFQSPIKVLDAAAATGVGKWIDVSDFRDLMFSLHTSGSASATIKIIGSFSDISPDPTTVASVTNEWFPVSLYDIDSAAGIVGSTGIVLAGTDVNKGYSINVNGLKWVTLYISAYSAGSITGVLKPFNNVL